MENNSPAGGGYLPGLRNSQNYVTRTLIKNGGSVAVCLPRAYREILGWELGHEVRIYMVGKVMCIQAAFDPHFHPQVIGVRPVPSEAIQPIMPGADDEPL